MKLQEVTTILKVSRGVVSVTTHLKLIFGSENP